MPAGIISGRPSARTGPSGHSNARSIPCPTNGCSRAGQGKLTAGKTRSDPGPPRSSRKNLSGTPAFEFLDIPASAGFFERDLEQALIDKLRQFLLELGKGFSFVGRQYRISTETSEFFIDLVFYHYILKCFVLIDLKTGQADAPGHRADGHVRAVVRRPDEDRRRRSHDRDHPLHGEGRDGCPVFGAARRAASSLHRGINSNLPSERELADEIEREKEIMRRPARDQPGT